MRLQRHHHHDDDEREAPSASPGPDERRLRLVPDDPALAAERRLRAAGGPQDVALYRCGCGYIFDSAVSTTVTCPHCGNEQAW
jgi:hypothetical protein